jgi:starvation-inducible DNA-binding protein
MQINIGLTESQRQGSIELLNLLLSDEYVLYTKTRNFHWNVTGRRFHDLHLFFETQYKELEEMIDQVAERVRQLGGFPMASLTQFLEHTRLAEELEIKEDSQEMLQKLTQDHEALIRSLRDDAHLAGAKFEDKGTEDFLLGIMTRHEKMAWMLRSMTEKQP